MRILATILCLYFLINCLIFVFARNAGKKEYEESVDRVSKRSGEENLNKIDLFYFLVTFFLGIPIVISGFLGRSQK